MPAPTARIAIVAAALVVALLGGFGLGRLTSGDGQGATANPPAATDPEASPHSHGTTAGQATADVGGLAVSSGGYTLVPEETAFTAGQPRDFAFRIVGRDGKPVTTFAVVHDKPLHLIVVRRDLSGYQHLHPAMAVDGRWRVPLNLPAAGAWRAYTDFTVDVGGQQTALTLGVDLSVAGDYAARALPAPAREAAVGGFSVSYEGAPVPGATQPIFFRVPGATLERYLAAYGHLVVVREGDLGYVHVHPEDRLVDGAVKFWLAVPSTGRYRMFFDFQVAGKVHTAEFTLVVS
ncbi:hypothetical protein [Phytohabitans aurantiacus]|uniref:Secreted protein n=1 Tax=Phytohabitans aurantiacus TaxID=3016789 RepID=A0ABQ5QTJ5_9ACTN|nr:hypothetical protein [Phytohabitans aurantiacus]GLH97818.1 hypothetical protein Pa4123_30930 [Phytohabitans aurantiacus]